VHGKNSVDISNMPAPWPQWPTVRGEDVGELEDRKRTEIVHRYSEEANAVGHFRLKNS